jgi:transcriptional regulator with XRE-family HTH domain
MLLSCNSSPNFEAKIAELMHFTDLHTDDAVLRELGHRLEHLRLARNISQAELGRMAGVSRATVVRVEAGDSVQMSTMVKLWRALDLLAEIDRAVPERLDSPMAQLERERRGRNRQRATSSSVRRRPVGDPPKPFRWGDET